MRSCPNCRTMVPMAARLCPFCNASLAPPAAPPVVGAVAARPLDPATTRRIIWGIGAVAVVFVLMMFGLVALNDVVAKQDRARAVAKAESDRRADEQMARIQADRARREAAAAASGTPGRGRKPKPSEWDGITPEANAHLKATLKDYDSMKIVNCSPVQEYGDDAWCQRVKYRARNSFGAYDLADELFVIRGGSVVDVVEY